MKPYKMKRIALGVLILAVAGLYFLVLKDYLTLEQLNAFKFRLLEVVREHFVLSVVVFNLLYITVAAFALPGAPVLTLAGGFVFGTITATVFVEISAVTGAVFAFLLSRYLAGQWVQRRFKTKLEPFNREIRENGANYSLTLRLIPLFPFTLINVGSGLTNISLFTFLWTTAVGIVPGTLVTAYTGSQLERLHTPGDFLSPESAGLWAALLFLGLFALLPVIFRRYCKTKADDL